MNTALERLSDNSPAPPDLLPRSPRRRLSCSEAGYRFQLQHFRVFDFFLFALKLSTNADKMRFKAAEALANGGSKEDVANFEEVRQNPEPTFRKL